MQLLESPIPPLTAAALRMIIYKRPAPHFDNHEKGMKMLFETLYNEMKCVLSVTESNLNKKKIKIFTFAYGQPDRKISTFFDDFPFSDKGEQWSDSGPIEI